MINLQTIFRPRTTTVKTFFNNNGIRIMHPYPGKATVQQLKKNWKAFANTIPAYPNSFSGKGIVICAGGFKYFTCAWVNIHLLRERGCTLPVEVWYTGDELTPEVVAVLRQLDVICRNALDHAGEGIGGYTLKPFAILHSRFKEVLFLDADNNSMHDPAYLFDSEVYRNTGALFWPDIWRTDKENPIWEIVGASDYNSPERESGQILIDKEKCWQALNLCLYFNINKEDYNRMLLGDKDTFRFAWKALGKPFHMISTPVGFCGYCTADNNNFHGISMVQHDPEGNILFIHRNLFKWDITCNGELVWQEIRRFKNNISMASFVVSGDQDFSGNGLGYDPDPGPQDHRIERISFQRLFGDVEEKCLSVLENLRQEPFYGRFMLNAYLGFFRPPDLTKYGIRLEKFQFINDR